MSVYIIARFNIHDRSEYDKYSAGFLEVFEKFDGKMLSVDEDPMVLAGAWDSLADQRRLPGDRETP